MSSAPPDSGSILKTKMPCDPASHVSNHKGISALLQNSVEKYLDRRRRGRSEPGATSPRRMVMRHGGGRGAEVMFRGAEPLCGCAAQGRKRAGRGYMLPLARVEHGLTLWQRMLPLKPEQGRTPRTTPSTRFYNRAPGKESLTRRWSRWNLFDSPSPSGKGAPHAPICPHPSAAESVGGWGDCGLKQPCACSLHRTYTAHWLPREACARRRNV